LVSGRIERLFEEEQACSACHWSSLEEGCLKRVWFCTFGTIISNVMLKWCVRSLPFDPPLPFFGYHISQYAAGTLRLLGNNESYSRLKAGGTSGLLGLLSCQHQHSICPTYEVSRIHLQALIGALGMSEGPTVIRGLEVCRAKATTNL